MVHKIGFRKKWNNGYNVIIIRLLDYNNQNGKLLGHCRVKVPSRLKMLRKDIVICLAENLGAPKNPLYPLGNNLYLNILNKLINTYISTNYCQSNDNP